MSFKRFYGVWVVVLIAALFPAGLVGAQASGTIPIVYGDTVEGQLTAKTYYVVYEFEGTQGDHVIITMTGDGSLDPYLGLLDGTNQEVLFEDDDSAGESNAMIEMDLPATDSYLIIATRYGLDTGASEGSYTLELQNGKNPVSAANTISNINISGDATGDTTSDNTTTQNTANTTEPEMIEPGVYYMGTLAIGDVVSGEISQDMYFLMYDIDLEAGTTVTITMAADNSELDSWIVLTSTSQELANDDNSGAALPGGGPLDASLTVTIPSAGIYYIGAAGLGADEGRTAGAFTLSVTLADQQGDASGDTNQQASEEVDYTQSVAYAGDIAIGDTVTGTIDDKNVLWFYALQGNANEEITITAVGSGGLDTYLGLSNDALDWLAEDDDSGGGELGLDAQLSYRFPETDTYLVFVFRAGIEEGTTSGDYTLTITSGSPAAPDGNADVAGFGGLPGRVLEGEQGTYYLRGFGWTDDPAKATSFQQAAVSAMGQ